MMHKTKGFTLTELAIVLIIIGIVVGMTAKLLPSFYRKSESVMQESEFKSAATSRLNSLVIRGRSGFLPAVSALTPYPVMQGFEDSHGTPWGYLPAYDTTEKSGNGVCNLIMNGSLTLRYCLDGECASYRDHTDIALIFFNNKQNLPNEIRYGANRSGILTEAEYKSSPLIITLKAAHSSGNDIAAYSYADLRRRLSCPDITATIPAASDLPAAYVGEPYRHSGMNFAGADGVKYCFTQEQPGKGFTINKIRFSARCDETGTWTEDKNHNDVWILSGVAPEKPGMLYFTGYARISHDGYTAEHRFALPVSVK